MSEQTPTPTMTPPESTGSTPPPAQTNGATALIPSLTPPVMPPVGTMTPPAPKAVPDEIVSEPTQEWIKALPDDLKAEKMFANFKNVEDLARSFVNAQKLIGRDKIPVPDPKVATEADYQAVFKKLGLPEDAKDYKMEIAQDAGLDPGFLDKIKVEAHRLGVLPKQLEKLLGWYSGESKEVMKEHTAKMQADHVAAHRALSQEWGKAYDKNLMAAQITLKDGATPEEIKYLEEQGLTTNATLIRIFSKLGNKFKEGELKGGTNNFGSVLPPATAKAEANRIMGDASHPYNQSGHVNHKQAVEQVQALMDQAYPEEPKE